VTRKKKRRDGLPKGAHRTRIEVTPDVRYFRGGGTRRGAYWNVTVDGRNVRFTKKKATAMRHAMAEARRIVRAGGFVTIRPHDRHGRFQKHAERTLPRWSDPTRSRG
jgi:hypothetical protein